MGNVVVASPVLSDAAELSTTGTVAPTLPLGNLQTMRPGKVCRFTDLSGMMIVADLGFAQPINLISLINHSGTSDATWRIRGASTQGNLTSAPGYDSGSSPVSMWPASGRPTDEGLLNPFSLHFLPTPQTFRWWRIDIADAANPDTYWQAGRLYIAAAWQPLRNLSYGWNMGFIDLSEIERTPGGQTLPTEGGRLKRLSFALKFGSEDDLYNNAWPLDLARGRSRDVLAVRDPEATVHLHRQSVYGLMAELSPIENLAFPVYSKGYAIEELLP